MDPAQTLHGQTKEYIDKLGRCKKVAISTFSAYLNRTTSFFLRNHSITKKKKGKSTPRRLRKEKEIVKAFITGLALLPCNNGVD